MKRYRIMLIEDGPLCVWREMRNTGLHLELSVFFNQLGFISKEIDFKTWIPDQCFMRDVLFKRNQRYVAVCSQR